MFLIGSAGVYYVIGAALIAVAITAMVFSANARADEVKLNPEATVQIHSQVLLTESMSKFDSLVKDKQGVQMYVNNCKTFRNNDPQCEVTGTEPVLAAVEFSLFRTDTAVIPLGMDVKKGDFVTDEISNLTNENHMLGSRLIAKHSANECEWTHPIKLAGSGRVECKDDEANGFENTFTYMKRFPLKHPESTLYKTNIAELFKDKVKAAPLSEAELLWVVSDKATAAVSDKAIKQNPHKETDAAVSETVDGKVEDKKN